MSHVPRTPRRTGAEPAAQLESDTPAALHLGPPSSQHKPWSSQPAGTTQRKIAAAEVQASFLDTALSLDGLEFVELLAFDRH